MTIGATDGVGADQGYIAWLDTELAQRAGHRQILNDSVRG